MRSLYIFLDERNLDTGIRISNENYTMYDRVKTLPIYAVSRLLCQ